jgi:integrase
VASRTADGRRSAPLAVDEYRPAERLVPVPSWAVTLRDRSNVHRVWREIRPTLELDGLLTHHLRKTVGSFLDDAEVPTRKIADQVGHSKVSMTGGPPGDRTLNPRIKSPLLCRLS